MKTTCDECGCADGHEVWCSVAEAQLVKHVVGLQRDLSRNEQDIAALERRIDRLSQDVATLQVRVSSGA